MAYYLAYPGKTYSVYAGQTTNDLVLSAGDVEVVFSGGVASDTTIDGGYQYVYSGGLDHGVTVTHGGTLSIAHGAILDGDVSLGSGALATLGSAPSPPSVVRFTGGGALLSMNAGFNGSIAGFGAGDRLQVFDAYSATVSFSEAADNTSGTLTIAAGPNSHTVSFIGQYVTSQFVPFFDPLDISDGTTVFFKSWDGQVLSVQGGASESGVILSSGSTQIVHQGGIASGTTILSGGFQDVDSGHVSGTVVSRGGTLSLGPGFSDVLDNDPYGFVSFYILGATAVGTVVDGGTEVVDTWAEDDAPHVINHGKIYAYGIVSSPVVSNASIDVVSVGVVVNGRIEAGGIEHLAALRYDSLMVGPPAGDEGSIIYSGGAMVVGLGGIADSTIIASGGAAYALSGGLFGLFQGTIESGGYLRVFGGDADNVTLSAGGAFSVSSGGASGPQIRGDGFFVAVSGTSYSPSISAGGVEHVLSGGAGSGGMVYSGGRIMAYAGGSTFDAVVNSGGGEYVVGGGAHDTVLSGGYLNVHSGGIATGTRIDRDGALAISSGGVASDSVVGSRGRESVSSGGSAVGTIVSGGGLERVVSGGVDSGAVISSGGLLTVAWSGGIGADITLAGGSAMLSGAVGTGHTMSFVGTGGDLLLDKSRVFSGGIAGFGHSDTVVLADLPYALSETLLFTEAANSLSGTLTVTDGPVSASLRMIGQYATSNFAAGLASGGGTAVTFIS